MFARPNEDSKHANIFTKKYACCKGKGKRAKENRKKLQLQKLNFIRQKAISILKVNKIKEEIKKLAKQKGEEKVTMTDIKNITDNINKETKQ